WGLRRSSDAPETSAAHRAAIDRRPPAPPAPDGRPSPSPTPRADPRRSTSPQSTGKPPALLSAPEARSLEGDRAARRPLPRDEASVEPSPGGGGGTRGPWAGGPSPGTG